MRVIAGEFRSRRIESTPGLDTRPTPDRLRETLFNVLAPRIEGAVFLDAYAGTGAVGIEALSRGAARAIFIERAKPALAVLHKNIASLGLEARVEIVAAKTLTVLERFSPDIAFLDPPYPMEREYPAALGMLAARPPVVVIVQHSARFDCGEAHGALRRTRVLRQGDNALSFYACPRAAAETTG